MLHEIQSAISRRAQVRLDRDEISARHVHGFPLRLESDLLLVHEVNDFRLDGYVVLRLRDITWVRDGECERFCEEVLKGEGHLAQVGEPPHPLLSAAAAKRPEFGVATAGHSQ